MHESLLEVLERNGFEVTGHQYTLDAAVIALRKKILEPDLFIINGLALVSGASGGVINRARSMLFRLRDIRILAPRSRILLFLPDQTSAEIINNIISLGIYDIHQISHFDEETLLGWIRNPKSLADYTGFSPAEVHDMERGEISYGNDEDGKSSLNRAMGGIQPGRGLISRIASSLGEMKNNVSVGTAGRVKPGVLLGIGDARIEEWIKNNFYDQMTVLASPVDPEEIKKTVMDLSPDICIFMRQGANGGIPDADHLAIWAALHVPALLLIVGELDEKGKEMADRAREAGIRHIITCERGGHIYGDELVYVLNTIVREMHGGRKAGLNTGESLYLNVKVGKKFNSLLQRGGILGRVLKQTVNTAPEKVRAKGVKKNARPRINRSDGICPDEISEQTVKSTRNPTAIVPGGVLAVVSPWRPNLAGRLAARAVKILSEVEGSKVAYIGASGNSTGAMWLEVPDEVLMMSDWRVPGSNYPVVQENIRIYAVDPAKDLSTECEEDLLRLLKEARKTSTYSVIDFAGDMAAAQKAAHLGRSVLLVVLPGNDPVEHKVSALWLRNIMDGKQNIVVGIDLRGVPQSIPEGVSPRVVIKNNPADALTLALRKNSREEFVWI